MVARPAAAPVAQVLRADGVDEPAQDGVGVPQVGDRLGEMSAGRHSG